MPTVMKNKNIKDFIRNETSFVFSELAFDKKEEGKEENYIRSMTFSTENENVNDDFFESYAVKLLHGNGNANFERIMKNGKFFRRHDTRSDPIGKLLNVRIENRTGKADVLFNSKDPESMRVLQMVDDGFLDGVSVGYRVIEIKETDRKNKYGKTILEATKWEAREVSVVSIEADSNTGFGRTLSINNDEKEIPKMTEEEKKAIELATAVRVEAETRAKVEAEFMAKEAKRIEEEKAVNTVRTEINKFQELYGKDCLTEGQRGEIESKKDINLAYRYIVENKRTVPFETKISVSNERQENFSRAMTDGIFAKTNNVAPDFVSKMNRDSLGFREMPLIELCKELLIVRGEKTRDELRFMSSMKIVGLAIGTRGISNGTADFTNILMDAMNKTARNALMLAPDSAWREIANEVKTNDFRSIHSVAMANMPSFIDHKLDESGRYKSVRVNDSKETYSVATYAYKFSLSRQAIINDNLKVFNDIIPSIAMSAERLIMELIAEIIVANASMGTPAGALFSTAHANLQGDLAPSIANLNTVHVALGKQTEMPVDGVASNRILGFPLRLILCTIANETKLNSIVNSELNVDTAASNETGRTRKTDIIRI